jgi:hypothetical protein
MSPAPDSSLGKLKFAITNLWDRFGQQDQIGVALAINMLFTVFGILVYIWAEGWIAFIGAVWAILHVIAVVKWFIGL